MAVTRQFHAVVAAGVLLAWLGATVRQEIWDIGHDVPLAVVCAALP